MALLNGVVINFSKNRFSGAFFSVHGPRIDPVVALERGCLTTTPLGACAQFARAAEQRSGGVDSMLFEFMNTTLLSPRRSTVALGDEH